MGLVLDSSILIAAERQKLQISKFLIAEAPSTPIFITSTNASEQFIVLPRLKSKRNVSDLWKAFWPKYL